MRYNKKLSSKILFSLYLNSRIVLLALSSGHGSFHNLTARFFSAADKAGKRGVGRGKIPGARSAQRGPEIWVKCSYIVYHRQFPEGQGPVFTNRHFVLGPVVGSRRPWHLGLMHDVCLVDLPLILPLLTNCELR